MVDFTRTRSRDFGSYVTNQWFEDNEKRAQCVNGPWVVSLDGQFSRTLARLESITDCYPHGPYREGDFKIGSVIRQRVYHETSPFEATLYETSCTNGTKSKVGKGFYVWPLRFSPAGTTPAAPAFVTTDINNLCRSALANANSPDVGLGETLAEGKAGLEMIRDPMKGFRDLVLKSVRGRGKKLRSLKDASSAWLEYRYGWTPLAMTIADVLKGLPSYSEDKIYDAKASTVVSSNTDWTTTESRVPNSGVYIRCNGGQSTTKRKTGRVYFTVVDANAYNRLKIGLDLLNVPGLAWELTRLSFAVDWFIGIGDYIAALMPNPYIRILGYTYAEKIVTTSTSRVVNLYVYPKTYNGSGTFTEVKETYRREVVSPNVTAPPTVDLDFRSYKHVLDSLGLITQQIPQQYGKSRRPFRS